MILFKLLLIFYTNSCKTYTHFYNYTSKELYESVPNINKNILLFSMATLYSFKDVLQDDLNPRLMVKFTTHNRNVHANLNNI